MVILAIAIQPTESSKRTDMVTGRMGMTQGNRFTPEMELRCDPTLCKNCVCSSDYQPNSITCTRLAVPVDWHCITCTRDGPFDWHCTDDHDIPLGWRIERAIVNCEESPDGSNVSCGIVYATQYDSFGFLFFYFCFVNVLIVITVYLLYVVLARMVPRPRERHEDPYVDHSRPPAYDQDDLSATPSTESNDSGSSEEDSPRPRRPISVK